MHIISYACILPLPVLFKFTEADRLTPTNGLVLNDCADIDADDNKDGIDNEDNIDGDGSDADNGDVPGGGTRDGKKEDS
uniref:Uncharacterized protein n=1 Tax=Trichobilharzia regenti TaxID=157069 RepID=A0AA85JFV4_TRIRE|nr:unnamed protein product [Trichobilharzia regenti]